MRSSGCTLLASASAKAVRLGRHVSKRASLPFRRAARYPTTLAAMPHELDYDAASRRLNIGAGFVANVSPEVWNYEVSGKNV